MDKIYLKNIEIFANHGVFQEEKALGQKFILSLELSLDFSKIRFGSSKEIAEEKNESQSDFIDNIKIDTKVVNSVTDKKNFLEEIKGNEEVLNMLSMDRLKKLEKYYDSVIAENEKKIRKLKATE